MQARRSTGRRWGLWPLAIFVVCRILWIPAHLAHEEHHSPAAPDPDGVACLEHGEGHGEEDRDHGHHEHGDPGDHDPHSVLDHGPDLFVVSAQEDGPLPLAMLPSGGSDLPSPRAISSAPPPEPPPPELRLPGFRRPRGPPRIA